MSLVANWGTEILGEGLEDRGVLSIDNGMQLESIEIRMFLGIGSRTAMRWHSPVERSGFGRSIWFILERVLDMGIKSWYLCWTASVSSDDPVTLKK